MTKLSKVLSSLPRAAELRRLSCVATLICAVASAPLAHAQDPAAGQASLNFVGADIESVIKAIGHYTGTTFIIDPRIKGTISVVSENRSASARRSSC